MSIKKQIIIVLIILMCILGASWGLFQLYSLNPLLHQKILAILFILLALALLFISLRELSANFDAFSTNLLIKLGMNKDLVDRLSTRWTPEEGFFSRYYLNMSPIGGGKSPYRFRGYAALSIALLLMFVGLYMIFSETLIIRTLDKLSPLP